MSNIFITNTSTDLQPRMDATIRIRYYEQAMEDPSGNVPKEDDFREVQLLEFHPDNDTCLKCRSTAYVRPERWMTHKVYKRAGEGYLKSSEQYVPIREFMILEEDRQALLAYCAKHRDRGPLIIHPCPQFDVQQSLVLQQPHLSLESNDGIAGCSNADPRAIAIVTNGD
jgi:hypothetical protein